MATSFPSAPAYTTPPNSQGVHTNHHGLQQFSPSDSATSTPVDQSPLSPNPSNFPTLPLSGRQLRPPKSPMYVPAALRPTERPHRPSPLTPPRSLHGSTDSLDRTGGESRPVSRRSTASTRKRITLNQVAEDETLIDDNNNNNDDNEEDDSDLPARRRRPQPHALETRLQGHRLRRRDLPQVLQPLRTPPPLPPLRPRLLQHPQPAQDPPRPQRGIPSRGRAEPGVPALLGSILLVARAAEFAE
ncbi:Zn finger protein [Xanthoria parietina]